MSEWAGVSQGDDYDEAADLADVLEDAPLVFGQYHPEYAQERPEPMYAYCHRCGRHHHRDEKRPWHA